MENASTNIYMREKKIIAVYSRSSFPPIKIKSIRLHHLFLLKNCKINQRLTYTILNQKKHIAVIKIELQLPVTNAPPPHLFTSHSQTNILQQH